MKISTSISIITAILAAGGNLVSAFSPTCNNNVAVYWGQNSYGGAGGAQSGWQKNLASYCQDSSIDIIPLAFVDVFSGTGGYPELNFANTCSDSSNPVFSGTDLANCSNMVADIQTCQSAGKKILISLGGAGGSYGFSSTSQAQAFADQIWNLFLGGSSSDRPFGSAVLDGVDLDIEGGGSTGYDAFINQLRSHYSGASKSYYISGAPQCPFPDAYLGPALNDAWFDFVFVQFYNNYCGVQNFGNANDWNFGTWDNWAKTTSVNKNVKVYIGVPASSTAAGSGYVPVSTLTTIIDQTRSQYSSFGGIMMWDASQEAANGNFAAAVKSALNSGSSCGTAPSTTTSKTTSSSSSSSTKTTSTTTKSSSTTSSSSSTPTSGSCSTVGQMVCVNNNNSPQYNECVNNVWQTYSCAAGTVCEQNGQGIYCGFQQKRSLKRSKIVSPSQVQNLNSQWAIDFAVIESNSTTTHFVTHVRSQRAGQTISKQWQLSFNFNHTITNTVGGNFKQKGNTVTLTASPAKNANVDEFMAVAVDLYTKVSQDEFLLPNPASASFRD